MIRRALRRRSPSDFAVGLAGIALIAIGLFFAFTKANPFASPYELNAIVKDAQNLKENSPVRVAGVEVGKVTGVEALEDGSGAARVTMELEDSALPIHEDAELQIRPRLFLEGNFVVDLKPGSPSAPELEDGGTVAIQRTAHSVSFEEVLKVLDKDSRASLQDLLDEYTRALAKGGARGFNRSIPWWEPAYRATALANDALLGEQEGDLRRVVRGQQALAEALTRDTRALQDLVTNLNTTTAAFAAEDDALAAAIPALRDVLEEGMPALASVNAALPSLRDFSREALPGVESAAPALRDARPFVGQLALLVRTTELQGLARDLRATIPDLAALNAEMIPFLEQNRALSSCTSGVLVPFATAPIPDPDFPQNSGEPFYQESQRAFTALAGESRTGDANGQWFRLLAGSGPTTIAMPGSGVLGDTLFAQPLFPKLGTRPAKPDARPQFRPDVPCETQEPPNLAAAKGPGDASVSTKPRETAASRARAERLEQELRQLRDFLARQRKGLPALDPLNLSERGERRLARRRGFRLTDDGLWRPVKEATR